MRCTNCGKSVDDQAKFCTYCGQLISREKNQKMPPKKKKMETRVKVALIIIFILLAAIGICIAYIYGTLTQGSGDEKRNEKEAVEAVKEDDAEEDSVLDTQTEAVEDTEEGGDVVWNGGAAVEEQVTEIRELYNGITASMNDNRYDKIALREGVLGYYDNSDLKAVVVKADTDGIAYTRYYYYNEGDLFFAYYEAEDAHRFYFADGSLIRWNYAENAMDAQNAVIYDGEDSTEYRQWENSVYTAGKNLIVERAPKVTMDSVSEVTASSYLSEKKIKHTADRVIDGSLANAWAEGADGPGIGENLRLKLDDVYTINTIYINAGYQKSSDLYKKNCRPKEITLEFSNGVTMDYTLDDLNGQQQIVLPNSVRTDSIKIIIQSVYAGTKYEDTLISEIYLE